ncbi:MAG: 50S ribosomal protein L19, partial [Candidatus Omnitrophica bacterium]|nr:50S ribosomal protein L19 [Candidatus Omnitrophota bacterium]
MDQQIRALEQSFLKSDRPHFKVGDTVRVFVRIMEEEK